MRFSVETPANRSHHINSCFIVSLVLFNLRYRRGYNSEKSQTVGYSLQTQRERSWDKVLASLSILDCPSKTQWSSGLYYADIISFTAHSTVRRWDDESILTITDFCPLLTSTCYKSTEPVSFYFQVLLLLRSLLVKASPKQILLLFLEVAC